MSAAVLSERIDTVRRFNRFYTRRIGLLGRSLLDSGLSLTEVRVLFEIAQAEGATATRIAQETGLDPGYLSRLLRRLHRSRLIRKQRSASDGRQWHVSLSRRGQAVFAALSQKAEAEIAGLLQDLGEDEQRGLVAAMQQIRATLDPVAGTSAPIVLRAHGPGDIGYITYRHGVLYAQEYGFDETFEAWVAEILGRFVQAHDPAKERLWVAERAGEVVGSIAAMKESDAVARLRVLLVEPSARGCGLGRMLVSECLRFVRRAGYEKVVLSTVSALAAARHLYEEAGFRCTGAQPTHRWSQDVVYESWELCCRSDNANHGAAS